ncbi:hypothetical protein ILYODFUR_035157 [Ilyodon furcidens]|uniref:Uncharacterized protein n=1 Tax=Ilyodon furcidens TaxID=33524 RepID=A0ABV0STY8_9TELE
MRRTSLTVNFGNSKRHLVNFVDSAITSALPHTDRKHRTILTLNEEVMHAPSAFAYRELPGETLYWFFTQIESNGI